MGNVRNVSPGGVVPSSDYTNMGEPRVSPSSCDIDPSVIVVKMVPSPLVIEHLRSCVREPFSRAVNASVPPELDGALGVNGSLCLRRDAVSRRYPFAVRFRSVRTRSSGFRDGLLSRNCRRRGDRGRSLQFLDGVNRQLVHTTSYGRNGATVTYRKAVHGATPTT